MNKFSRITIPLMLASAGMICFARSSKPNPDPEAYYSTPNIEMALKAFEENNATAAESLLKAAIKEDKNNYVAWSLLSSIELYKGDCKMAQKYAQKSVDLAKGSQIHSNTLLNLYDIELTCKQDTNLFITRVFEITKDPEAAPIAFQSLSKIYNQKGDVKNAIMCLDNAIHLSPSCELYTDRAFFEEFGSDKSIDFLSKGIDIADNYDDLEKALTARAVCYLLAERSAPAISDCIDAFLINPNGNVGFAENFNSTFPEVFIDSVMNRADANPNNYLLTGLVARLLSSQNDYETALEYGLKSVALNNSPYNNELTGTALYNLNDIPEAIKYLYKASVENPNINLIEALIDNGQQSDAIDILSGLFDAGNDAPYYYLLRASAYMQSGDYLNAVKDYALINAIIEYPYISTIVSQGDALAKAGRADEAKTLYQRAIDLCNQDSISADEMIDWLPLALLGTGDIEEADKTVAQIVDLYPYPFASTAYNLACYLTRKGDYPRAIEVLHYAIENGESPYIAEQDPDFIPIRSLPEFQSIIADEKAAIAAKTQRIKDKVAAGGPLTNFNQLPVTQIAIVHKDSLKDETGKVMEYVIELSPFQKIFQKHE